MTMNNKYTDIKEFIKNEFMGELVKSPDVFHLEEDDDNYYITATLKDEKYTLVTFYKDKIKMAMELYNQENFLDLGTIVEIDPETGEINKEA
jgi:hypothetical protein